MTTNTKTPYFFTRNPPPIMVFDVESVGLHGQAFAFGYVVIHNEKEVDHGRFSCPTSTVEGTDEDLEWVLKNTPKLIPNCRNPAELTIIFWNLWKRWKADGALLAADCAWPVEARFLMECVDLDKEGRKWEGPYPMLEISSFLMAANMDPMVEYVRLDDELPKHCPLADARQSARLLMDALKQITHPKSGQQRTFWMCPICSHVMTEEQSKGYKHCPTGVHAVPHVPFFI